MGSLSHAHLSLSRSLSHTHRLSLTHTHPSAGKFVIDGIERAKAGVPQIVVTFDIDANGILKVRESVSVCV